MRLRGIVRMWMSVAKPYSGAAAESLSRCGLRGLHMVLLAVLLAVLAAVPAGASLTGTWRLQLRDAAVVHGDMVLLGEIASPVGEMPPELWQQLARRPLWESPDKTGRTMSITGPRLKRAMRRYLPEHHRKCLYPASMAVQKGGGLYDEAALRKVVADSLTPRLAALDGEASLRDYRLPAFMFVEDPLNTVMLMTDDVRAGRLSLRLAEVRPTGDVVRQATGSVFVDVWTGVPAAAFPVNRGDLLGPDAVTMVRKNRAFMRGDPWDGKGGPWRLTRAVGQGQVIYAADLEIMPTVARGDRVDLVFRGSRILLTVPAEALADGAAGDSIPVRNLQSRRQVYATVKDPTTVIVQ